MDFVNYKRIMHKQIRASAYPRARTVYNRIDYRILLFVSYESFTNVLYTISIYLYYAYIRIVSGIKMFPLYSDKVKRWIKKKDIFFLILFIDIDKASVRVNIYNFDKIIEFKYTINLNSIIC